MPNSFAYCSALLLLSLAVAASTPDDATCLLQAPTLTHVAKRQAKKLPFSAEEGSRRMMDHIAGVIKLCSSSAAINLLQILVVAFVAVQVMKATNKTASSEQGAVHTGRGYGPSLKGVLKEYGPEMCGLVACLALALIIQTQGSMAAINNALQETAVRELLRRWPTLLTADSLLELQSMLRLVVLVSSVSRKANGRTLLAQEVAALLCAAAIGRTVLVARSRAYMLDGPLGGGLPAACDLLSVPLLAILAFSITKGALMASALAIVAAACVGSQNSLSLAGDALSDGLFIFVHTAELFAAFAYLFRALLSDVEVKFAGRQSVALRFAHVMMPIQTCLSAYYFLEIHELTENRANVSAGYPSEILRVGGMAQLMAYAAAAMLHFAVRREPPAKDCSLANESPCTLVKESPHVMAD